MSSYLTWSSEFFLSCLFLEFFFFQIIIYVLLQGEVSGKAWSINFWAFTLNCHRLITGFYYVTFQYVNPAFERMTGYWRSEVIGHPKSLVMNSEHEKPVSSSIPFDLLPMEQIALLWINYEDLTRWPFVNKKLNK